MLFYTEQKNSLTKVAYSQTLLQCHTLYTTNTGFKAGVVAPESVCLFAQNISNTVPPTDGFTP
jgi:hypothetical protein